MFLQVQIAWLFCRSNCRSGFTRHIFFNCFPKCISRTSMFTFICSRSGHVSGSCRAAGTASASSSFPFPDGQFHKISALAARSGVPVFKVISLFVIFVENCESINQYFYPDRESRIRKAKCYLRCKIRCVRGSRRK